jgi:hypothetical protein
MFNNFSFQHPWFFLLLLLLPLLVWLRNRRVGQREATVKMPT